MFAWRQAFLSGLDPLPGRQQDGVFAGDQTLARKGDDLVRHDTAPVEPFT
jgi:hypothetical protein